MNSLLEMEEIHVLVQEIWTDKDKTDFDKFTELKNIGQGQKQTA